MNILVFSWRDPKHPIAGGAEQVMHEHMKGWIAAGHKVTYFSSRFKGSKEEEIIDRVKIIRKGATLLGVQLAAFFWYLLKNKEKFDIVIDQFHGLPFFAPLYTNTKVVAVIQEIAGEVWFSNPLPKPINYIIGYIGYITEPICFMFYKKTKFITGSESAKNDVIKMGIPEKNIYVVPHGVLLDLPEIIPNKNKKITITFLGALTKDKGIEDVIKTFALLNMNNPNWNYWVIGKGDNEYVNYLKQLARPLKDKITFYGFVSQKDKFKLLARSHILVNASIREGWGLVNIEANSVGTPVVAYKSVGLIDSIKEGKNGIFSDEKNPLSLSKSIEKLVLNPSKYNKLSKSAIKWSKKFNWETSKKLSLEIIEKR